ncbi:MAG: hypothetical protein HDT28_05795 [Clostridiales bacterium]|nr:hypothetical protein [Clostridiales bacterium]
MAKKQKTTRTTQTTRTTRTSSGTGISLNKFAFWIVVAIGIAMLVSGVLNFFNWSWVNAACSWIMSLCFALGMFVPVILSYRVARNKGTGWFVLWIILVVFVVFGLVSRIIGLIRFF